MRLFAPQCAGRVARALAAGAIALLALAGCSAGQGGNPTAGNAPLNLGMLAPLTGARADLGHGMVTGADLALSVINSRGGVLGHQAKLVVQDDAADPVDAVPAAQKEISTDHVVSIVGPISQTAPAVIPLASRANIPDLMWGGGAAFDHVTDGHFFRMSPSDTEMSDAMTVFAHSKGWDRVALAIGNTTGDQSLVPGIRDAAQKLGMTITAQVTIALGSTSFRSEISTLFAGHPQAILGQFDIPSAGVLFGELRQEGLTSTPWVGSNLWFAREFFGSVGAATASGPVYIANPGTENQGYPNFLKLLKKQTGANQPSNGQTFMYDAVNIWALGALEAGSWSFPAIERGILKAANGPGQQCFDYPSCYELLKAGHSINYQGAASSVDFDQYHNVYGPFDIVHYNADGSTGSVVVLTPTAITSALK